MKVLIIATIAVMLTLIAGCRTDAQIASANLSTAADQFEIERRIVFYNGITESYILVIEGRCSIVPNLNKLKVTCRTGEKDFKKHYLGLSDNVTYFVEQLETAEVGVYHYRVIFKPQSIIPDIDFVSG